MPLHIPELCVAIGGVELLLTFGREVDFDVLFRLARRFNLVLLFCGFFDFRFRLFLCEPCPESFGFRCTAKLEHGSSRTFSFTGAASVNNVSMCDAHNKHARVGIPWYSAN